VIHLESVFEEENWVLQSNDLLVERSVYALKYRIEIELESALLYYRHAPEESGSHLGRMHTADIVEASRSFVEFKVLVAAAARADNLQRVHGTASFLVEIVARSL
jgi:hypothetical protein